MGLSPNDGAQQGLGMILSDTAMMTCCGSLKPELHLLKGGLRDFVEHDVQKHMVNGSQRSRAQVALDSLNLSDRRRQVIASI